MEDVSNQSPRISGVDDFFTVPTLTGRVLFVVIVLSNVRRRIVHFNITEHPTAEWTAQQAVDAFTDDTAPRWLHRDRDGVNATIIGYREYDHGGDQREHAGRHVMGLRTSAMLIAKWL